MKTEKDFITAVDQMIEKITVSNKHNYQQKVLAITSLTIMRRDIKDGFKDMRRYLKMKDKI